MRPTVRSGTLAATLLAGAVALGLTWAPAPERGVSTTGPAGSVPTARPQVTLQAPLAPAGAAPVARTEPRATPGLDRRSRLRALVERLARRLHSEAFHEPTWDTELAAGARPFEAQDLEALGARQAELSDDEALVLGGLLCARLEIDREAGPAAPEALLERWRSSLADERALDGAVGTLALRSLAALGSSADARRLLRLARLEVAPARAARRALAHAGDACVPRSLAELAEDVEEARWSLPILAGLGQRMAWRFDPLLSDEVAGRLAALLDDPRRAVAQRALASHALAAWSPPEALSLLRSTPRERPFSEPERALLRALEGTPWADEALGLLAERLDGRADPETSLALAEDLAFLPGGRVAGAPWSGPLLSALERAALESADPARRRRALRGLGSLSTPQASPALRALAEGDADPSVRALAARLASRRDPR